MNSPQLPICCNTEAFGTMENLSRDLDAPQSLLSAAVAISLHAIPDASVKEAQRRITAMSRVVSSRVHGTQVQALVAHLHEFLFEELGMEGNASDYYNPNNSLFPSVLRTHKGLPITLSLLYKLVGDGIGLNVWGVGLPGHFVAGVDMGNGKSALVDTFAGGRLLGLDEAKDRVANHFGNQVEWSSRLIEPVTNRYWITRILQNLLTSYGKTGQYAEISAVLEMELLLWPEESRLQRDLAVVLARVGKQDLASEWLEHYLHNNPEDPNGEDLRQLLASLS